MVLRTLFLPPTLRCAQDGAPDSVLVEVYPPPWVRCGMSEIEGEITERITVDLSNSVYFRLAQDVVFIDCERANGAS